MGKWSKIVGASHAQLEALPSKKAAGEPAGVLNVLFENRSAVPVDVEVRSLQSSDVSVATVNPPTPSLKVHLSRRPNKASARTPFSKKVSVGTWTPVAIGATTLAAVIDAVPPDVGTGIPTEDVSVT